MIALLLAANAFALDHELTFELGTLANPDPSFDLFADNDVLPSRGVRAVVALNDRVGLSAGWQHSGRGSTVATEGAYVDEELDIWSSGEFQAALRADQFRVGPIADVELLQGALAPYVRADLVVMRSSAWLTDADSRRSNPTEIKEVALTTGFSAMGGLAVNIPGLLGFDPTVHLEAGTTHLFSPLQFETLGSVQPGGFTLNGGIGLRY